MRNIVATVVPNLTVFDQLFAQISVNESDGAFFGPPGTHFNQRHILVTEN